MDSKVIRGNQKEIIISLNNVSFEYDQQYFSVLILNNISFIVYEGDILGVIGPNDVGKTRLFKCILVKQNSYSGHILIINQNIWKNNNAHQKIDYVLQKKSIEPRFPVTVIEIISFSMRGIRAKRMISSNPKKLATNNNNCYQNINDNKIDKSIETVGPLKPKNKRIEELSGGKQQRILIAKVLVNDHNLVLLDEPTTTGIDKDTQNKSYALLQKLDKDNKLSIILSSYDLDTISKITNKVACINRKIFFMVICKNFSKMMAFPGLFSPSQNRINHVQS